MILAITPGDPEGIGPEIVWKTLKNRPKGLSGVQFLCVGAREPFDRLGAPVQEVDFESLLSGAIKPPRSTEPFVWLIPAPLKASRASAGSRSGPNRLHLPGFQSGWSIERATQLVRNRIANAIVTGPISKERLQKGGFPYPGHTEFLAELCGVKRVTMMLANDTLRVTLVTTHLALKDVSKNLKRSAIELCIAQTIGSLRDWWKIPKPRIAVLGLNPHAGEAGLFGNEETKVIAPAIEAMRNKLGANAIISGPHPADTLFAKHVMAKPEDRYDAVVCMYHDQGLIPVKYLGVEQGVNITLGLPLVRTSPDHGTAFDIAGTGKADASSLLAAIRAARQ